MSDETQKELPPVETIRVPAGDGLINWEIIFPKSYKSAAEAIEAGLPYYNIFRVNSGKKEVTVFPRGTEFRARTFKTIYKLV
jgi:hypothetical protein